MTNCYSKNTLVFALIALLVFAGGVFAAYNSGKAAEKDYLEERGVELKTIERTGNYGSLILDALPDSFDVLLIPESGDDYIGMYDPITGDYMGVFIPGYESFSTPICAISGPDDNIYISDQVADAVFVFDRDGNYLSTYADGSDGLNNIRGIAFRGDMLFITSGDDYVAAFDGPHSRRDDFINDGTDPFDIFFMEDGRALLADIQGNTDNIRIYDENGAFVSQIFSISFPEQIQSDPLAPGVYLNNAFSADVICDFELDNSYNYQITFDSGRGVYRLGNGNILATNNDGVFELNPENGSVISQKNEGSMRFIERIPALITTGIGDAETVPGKYKLNGNYPNPFNASTMIKYELPKKSHVTISVYDILGQHVATLYDGMQDIGYHEVIWQTNDFASGVYFYKIAADNFTQTRKMSLIK